MSSKNKNKETKGITARFILEIIGRPPEHLVETLEKLIESMNNEKGVKVISKDIKEPVEMKGSEQVQAFPDKDAERKQKSFYTTFAEVEVETEEIFDLTLLMFKYMPAHIEIISPELIALTNNGWGTILNEIVIRLHQYDEIARVVQVEKQVLENKLRELLEEQRQQKSKGICP